MQKPRAILKLIAIEYGNTILAQSRLKGLILDMMPTAEKKYLNVLRRAIDEKIGARLLEMKHDKPDVRQIKISILKEEFRNDNAFDDTANYIVDSFLHALGWDVPEQEVFLPFKVIKIGNQIWADRNLDVSHFRNGDPIPHAESYEEWQKAGEKQYPAWCHYNNDAEYNKIYGKLYNWYAVNDSRGLAPAGWHVPSDNEWAELISFLGGEEFTSVKLKSKQGWFNNENVLDIFGFSALPGGIRITDSYFCNEIIAGAWWSSTEYLNNDAWGRIFYGMDNLTHTRYNKSSGRSVRCVRYVY